MCILYILYIERKYKRLPLHYEATAQEVLRVINPRILVACKSSGLVFTFPVLVVKRTNHW